MEKQRQSTFWLLFLENFSNNFTLLKLHVKSLSWGILMI